MSAQLQRVQPAAAGLTVSGIVKAYGGVRAVNDCSFEVGSGSITGLIGPNGAGKSTMLGIIAGAIKQDAGTVTFEGTFCRHPAHRVARLGIARTFQIPQEFPALTVLENMMVAPIGQKGEGIWAALAGPRVWRANERQELDRAWDLLDRFQLTHLAHEYAANLSGGQKKLLEFARALQSRPKMLLLDEPMAGVNPQLALQLEAHIREIAHGGITVLLVEHEMGLVSRLCNPVVVMAQGSVLAEGTFDEIRADEQVVAAYLGA